VLVALAEAGLAPVLGADGDVGVRIEDQHLFVTCVESEPPLLRVFGQWLIGAMDELVALRAANAVTAAVNLVKVTVHEERLVVAADLLVPPGVELHALLPASLDAVLGTVHTWHEAVGLLAEHAAMEEGR
jgi:hypothetical protein